MVGEVKGIEMIGVLGAGRGAREMMMTFITQGGEGRGKTNKKRKATKSKGRGLEEGASRALMRRAVIRQGERRRDTTGTKVTSNFSEVFLKRVTC